MAGYSSWHPFPFTQLPTELRLKVWAYSLTRGRIVPIRCNPQDADILDIASASGRASKPPPYCFSTAPVPTNLQVCRESRAEALKSYRLMFGLCGRSDTGIFFDPTVDTLYFGFCSSSSLASSQQFTSFLALASPEDLALVRCVALNEGLMPDPRKEIPGGHPQTSGYPATGSNNTHDRHGDVKIPACRGEEEGCSRGQLLPEVVLRYVNTFFPNLEQLAIVSLDENPVYSGNALLVEPRVANQMVNRRMRQAVRSLQRQLGEGWTHPHWVFRSIAAGSDDPPSYSESVMGWVDRGPMTQKTAGTMTAMTVTKARSVAAVEQSRAQASKKRAETGRRSEAASSIRHSNATPASVQDRDNKRDTEQTRPSKGSRQPPVDMPLPWSKADEAEANNNVTADDHHSTAMAAGLSDAETNVALPSGSYGGGGDGKAGKGPSLRYTGDDDDDEGRDELKPQYLEAKPDGLQNLAACPLASPEEFSRLVYRHFRDS